MLSHALHALLISFICTLTRSQSTMTVSVISTTTIHATNSDSNACNNFYGACVVYGDNGAPSTTTIYRDTTARPTDATASTTIIRTTTVSDAGACSDFAGSCVVYGGENGEAAYTTTANSQHGSAAAGQQPLGNSDGYIAKHKGQRPAVVGAGASLSAQACITALFLVLVSVMLWI